MIRLRPRQGVLLIVAALLAFDASCHPKSAPPAATKPKSPVQVYKPPTEPPTPTLRPGEPTRRPVPAC